MSKNRDEQPGARCRFAGGNVAIPRACMCSSMYTAALLCYGAKVMIDEEQREMCGPELLPMVSSFLLGFCPGKYTDCSRWKESSAVSE